MLQTEELHTYSKKFNTRAKHGGVVMGVCIWCFKPAPPLFWINCSPNEEVIENLQIISYCSIKIVLSI